MSSSNRRTMLTVFIILLIIFEALVYIATAPRPREQFFQIYLLGAKRMAADYYPDGDPDIRIREQVNWYLGVTNLMGSVQLIALRVKLGNSTISAPNDTRSLQSLAPLATEFKRFMEDNETWEFPFVWQILNASTAQGSARILALQINNQTILTSGLWARNGYNFRFIIELWTWDTESANFQFGWFTPNGHRVAWLQIWFNATSVT